MRTICLEPRCPNPATYRGRCATHSRERERQINRAEPGKYGSKRWRITRRAKLFQTPLCERCGMIATDVHHRRDLADGGDMFDRAGLESLCASCHGRETRRRQLHNPAETPQEAA